MATETKIQEFVHALEEGGWVGKVRLVVLLTVITAVYCLLIFFQFRGLAHPKAIDQAQIARELSHGNGFTTKFIRPLALVQFQEHTGSFPLERTPDTYHAPLNPFVESLAFRFFNALNSGLKTAGERRAVLQRFVFEPEMSPQALIYSYDRIIAAVSMLFFVISVGVNFVIAKRLFDRRLALLGMGLMLVCSVFWNFAMSGLPQMLMLLIFSGCVYVLIRALEAHEAGNRMMRLWVALAGAGFGLLALTHGLAMWMFFGALIFVAVAFWPREGTIAMRVLKNPALLMLAVFLAFYVPWLVRTYRVCGNPLGSGWFSILYQITGGTESEIMRASQLDVTNIGPISFRHKLQLQLILQFSNLYGLLGCSLVAPVFFVALLHLFKRPITARFRWCVLLMWLFAVLGMATFGFDEEAGSLHANDLHVLFIPLMTFYGLAFVLVLWSRLVNERPKLNIRLARIGFFVLIYLICAFPMISMLLLATRNSPIQWPPYAPPFIALMDKWFSEDESIASDMPWAVAWYANRRSLWLPRKIDDYMQWSDYQPFNGSIVALYLTPVTGNKSLIADIWKGEYKDWAPFILRSVNVKGFPLRAVTALPIDGACVIYADRARWVEKPD